MSLPGAGTSQAPRGARRASGPRAGEPGSVWGSRRSRKLCPRPGCNQAAATARRGASHLLLSQLGRNFLLPGPGPTPPAGLRGWRGRRRRQVPSAGNASQHPPLPAAVPGAGRAARSAAIGRQRPGAGPGEPVSHGPPQKSPGYCRAHWSPGQRAAFPAPAGWVLGILVCFGSLAFYKPLDLTCLCTPHFHSMSPCSCASNR